MAVVAEDWVSMSAPEAGASSSAATVDAPANDATYSLRAVAAVEERTALELDTDASAHVGVAANDATYDRRCRPVLCVVLGSILYEEYHRFGTSSYRAADSSIDVSPKRYRYIGKERDEETGLDHMGARYYAAWLGRWTAADPIGLVDGPGRYNYARNNPVRLSDPSGTQGEPFNPAEFDLPFEPDVRAAIAEAEAAGAGEEELSILSTTAANFGPGKLVTVDDCGGRVACANSKGSEATNE